MPVDIGSYIETIEQQIGGLPRDRKVFFAAWCCDPLFSRFIEHLRERGNRERVERLSREYEEIWALLVGAGSCLPDARELAQACEDCLHVWPEGEDGDESEAFLDYGAVELLTCLRRTFQTCLEDSSRAAAEAAERLINTLDYDLNMCRDVDDTLSHPEMLTEFDRQGKMLAVLRQAAEIRHEHRRMFRE